MNKMIQIRALKYPDIPHYEWEGQLIESTPDHVIVFCKPGRQLIHHTKNKVFTMEHASIEYFSLKEWFTAAMAVVDGEVSFTYCNVAMPSVWTDKGLQFTDLDLDLIREKDKEWVVVDEDEFESNSMMYRYPVELKSEVIDALERLKNKAMHKTFPFNLDFIRKYAFHDSLYE